MQKEKKIKQLFKLARELVNNATENITITTYRVEPNTIWERIKVALMLLIAGYCDNCRVAMRGRDYNGTTPMIIKCNHPKYILCERCGERVNFGIKNNGSDTP